MDSFSLQYHKFTVKGKLSYDDDGEPTLDKKNFWRMVTEAIIKNSDANCFFNELNSITCEIEIVFLPKDVAENIDDIQDYEVIKTQAKLYDGFFENDDVFLEPEGKIMTATESEGEGRLASLFNDFRSLKEDEDYTIFIKIENATGLIQLPGDWDEDLDDDVDDKKYRASTDRDLFHGSTRWDARDEPEFED